MAARRLVLVEDDAPLRALLRTLFESIAGLQVITEASNGEVAVQEARRQAPDVVVLDLLMPVMDGFAALPKLRAAAPRSHIVVLSMLSDAGLKQRCLDLGADEVLSKALSNDAIVDHVGRLARKTPMSR